MSQERAGSAPGADQTERRPGEGLLLGLLLAFSIFILITALKIPRLENLSSSGAFPIFIASVMILSTLCSVWKTRRPRAARSAGEELRQAVSLVFPKTVGLFAGILVLYILLLEPLRFWLSSFLFLVGSFVFLRGAGWARSLVIAAGLLAAVFVVFQFIFRVILW